MSLRADVEMDIDSHLLSSRYVHDFEMYWEGDVNEMPDYIDMGVWLDDKGEMK